MSLSAGKPGNAHPSSKQKVSQCLGSLQTWDFRTVMNSAPSPIVTMLNKETQGGWTAIFLC